MPEVKIVMFYRQRGGDGKLLISTTAPIVVIGWLTLLLRIQENIGPETCYPD
jgi:hypothetical protein